MLSRRKFLSKVGLLGLGGVLLGKWCIPQEVRAEKELGIDEKYHQESSITLRNIFSVPRVKEPIPPLFKTYPDAKKIALPKDFSYRGLSLEEAITKRRSKRNFIQQPLSVRELSCLLHYASGITIGKGERGFRAAPSAGALYPIEIYPVVQQVDGIKPGIYHYSIQDHSLELLKEGDYRQKMAEYCLGQEFVARAGVVFILTAIFARARWKYRNRAYRYVLMESGHISENIYLSATSMGLGSCAIGAFFDDLINKELNIDGEKEAVIYITVVGKVGSVK